VPMVAMMDLLVRSPGRAHRGLDGGRATEATGAAPEGPQLQRRTAGDRLFCFAMQRPKAGGK